jgi:hypothetical protein
MRFLQLILACVMITIAGVGCSPSPATPTQTTATTTLDPSFLQPTPFTGQITLEMLKNGEYQAKNGMTLVKLVDGKFESTSGDEPLSVSMLDQAAFGDLNSDGIQDAAILLVENYGGSGDFLTLVPVFNNGTALSPSSGYLLGDRVKVNAISIQDGQISMDMLVHAPNDGLCCPSQVMTQSFRFYWGPGLVMVNATSGTPAESKREIVIEVPSGGRQVSNQIQVKGFVSIAPFENTLLVRVLDGNNTPLYEGPIMVSAVDMGTPGTFDALIDISNSGASPGLIRIEVVEVSMADGSTLALDSVDVTLK